MLAMYLTLCNWASVIINPSYKLFKCGFFSVISAFGTLSVAFPNISATSKRSLQKPWIPNSLASLICLVSLTRIFSPSASALLYLSSSASLDSLSSASSLLMSSSSVFIFSVASCSRDTLAASGFFSSVIVP